jgi:16S rRNA U516 pseudouridylate synthase RsuA-like enzyme
LIITTDGKIESHSINNSEFDKEYYAVQVDGEITDDIDVIVA